MMTESQAHRNKVDGGRSPLPPEVAFELLADRTRIFLFQYCRHSAGPVELRDLADQLVTGDETAAIDVESTVMKLYHVHIPKLEAADVLAFDRHQRVVSLTVRADSLIPYLDVALEHDVPSSAGNSEADSGY